MVIPNRVYLLLNTPISRIHTASVESIVHIILFFFSFFLFFLCKVPTSHLVSKYDYQASTNGQFAKQSFSAMPWIGRASTQLQSAKLIDGPTFNKDGWLKLEYVYFVKMPLLKAWNCIGYLYMAGLVILLCRVIICHFSFYSMVNTINQVQIHRFQSKWLRNPN